MGETGYPGSQVSTQNARSEQRLVRLLFARLGLTVLSFGIAIGLDGLGRDFPPSARQGLYLTVAVAFATSVISGLLLGRVRHPERFAAVQIATDVGIVTALVQFSGGRESVFTFLYVVVTLYGAVLFERRGAMLAASLSAAAYGVVLFGASAGLLTGHLEDPGGLPLGVTGAIWAVHVGALYLVGVLASLLSSELQSTGRALDRSTHDLHCLRNLHQRTVESIMSGLLTTDEDGRITSFNPEAERMTGLGSEEASGRPVEEVIPGATRLVLRPGAERRVTGGSRTRLAYRNRRGEDLFLGLAASILKDADGEPLGHVVIFQDVTEVVAMEQGLRRSERLAAVGEMAAKIAHEIRNPLASMSGSIQILRAMPGAESGDGESGRLMEIVVRETDRLNALITDFLQYSRPAPAVPEAVDVSCMLEEMVELLHAACPENVKVEFDAGPQVEVLADPDQLRQVLWNLSINGLEAMPDGGVLRISIAAAPGDLPQEGSALLRNEGEDVQIEPERETSCVEIAIQDSGVGIGQEVQERMFEPFFTTKTQGTGLGLATVHRIIESHGGALMLESVAGAGATFRVRLPGVEVA